MGTTYPHGAYGSRLLARERETRYPALRTMKGRVLWRDNETAQSVLLTI